MPLFWHSFLIRAACEKFEAQSAGLEHGTLNPLVVEVMREIGLDLSANKTKSVFDVFKTGQLFAYVITVCDQASAERCPVFPGVTSRLHWSFPDPATVTGTHEERLEKIRAIRDTIQGKIDAWCEKVCTASAS